MTKEQIGDILRQLRLSAQMTQKEAAEKLGRRQQIIGHWETGYSQPDADTLFQLCDIYGASVDEAFGFKQKNSPAKAEASTEVTYTPEALEVAGAYEKADDKTKSIVRLALDISPAASSTENWPTVRMAARGGGVIDVPQDPATAAEREEANRRDLERFRQIKPDPNL